LIADESKESFRSERGRVARLTIPELIALLESPRLATRFCAEMRLRDLAGL